MRFRYVAVIEIDVPEATSTLDAPSTFDVVDEIAALAQSAMEHGLIPVEDDSYQFNGVRAALADESDPNSPPVPAEVVHDSMDVTDSVVIDTPAGHDLYERLLQHPNTVMLIRYTDEDIESYADGAGVSMEVARERAENWARAIQDHASELISTQLESVIKHDQP